MTTTTPKKPNITAAHLIHFTFSFKKITPKTVRRMGAKLIKIYTFANGSVAIPIKKHNPANVSSVPLKISSFDLKSFLKLKIFFT